MEKWVLKKKDAEKEKKKRHDLRLEDGRSRVHSEVSVYSREHSSTSPAV